LKRVFTKSSDKLSACLEADCGWIGRLEEVIWGVSGEVSQISELDDVVSIFTLLAGIVKIEC
jgi:hypothetical protein